VRTTPRNELPLSRRSFLSRTALAVTAATAGGGLLAACGTESETGGGGDSSGGGTRKMTFLSPIPLETLSLAPELLAVAGGYFEKHGLEVELQATKGTAQAMQTLLSGVAPIARIGQIDAMTAIATAGQPLVNIAMPFRTTALRFVYSKKNHPIEKPQDMVGTTMGVPSEGGTSDKVVSLVLANAGIAPTEVKRQVVGLSPGTFNLVQQGRIAGYVVSIDTANILTAQNPDAGVFDPTKYVKSDGQLYATTKETLTKEADNLRRFLAAVREAMAFMVADENFDETITILRGKYKFATLDNDAIARASLGMLRESWTGGDRSKPLLVTDEAAWAAGYKELTDAGLLQSGEDPKSWIDNSLLPKS